MTSNYWRGYRKGYYVGMIWGALSAIVLYTLLLLYYSGVIYTF